MSQEIIQQCVETVKKVQERSPLVHSITNSVVTNTTANILLALGASPLMAHAVEELEEIVAISQALVINIGTLDKAQIESMRIAMAYALKSNIPTVLDPVGAGASQLRTQTSIQLIENGKPAVIRGNSSEILALAALQENTSRGVDANDSVDTAKEAAQFLAKKYSTVVSVSGEYDYITDGEKSASVHAKSANALPLDVIGKITGMGCSCTAITAACAAVQSNFFIAALTAMAIMKSVQVEACKNAKGPASLQIHILDNLYTLKPESISPYIIC